MFIQIIKRAVSPLGRIVKTDRSRCSGPGATPAMVEALEERLLLSGNVVVRMDHGRLIIRGDRADNQITLAMDAAGLHVSGQNDTTINGQSAAQLFQAPADGAYIRLYEGDDQLTIRNLTLDGALRIRAGEGNDLILLDQTNASGRLRIDSWRGDDNITLQQSTFGEVRIGADNGDDGVLVENVTVAGRLQLGAAKGDDVLTVNQSTAGSATLGSGSGQDALLMYGQSNFHDHLRTKNVSQDATQVQPAVPSNLTTANFDFRNGTQGWEGVLGDQGAERGNFDSKGRLIPSTEQQREEFAHFQSGLHPLPAELNTPGTGYLLSGGHGPSFLTTFLQRRLGPEDGIVPGQTYQIQFDITFASNTPSGGITFGGGVGLRAGASPIEPRVVDNSVQMGTDHEANSAHYASFVDGVANGIDADQHGKGPYPYISLQRHHVHPDPITATAAGELWLVVGAGGGFEGSVPIYYEQINVTLTPVATP